MTEIILGCGHPATIPPALAGAPLLVCMRCCTAQRFVTAEQAR